MGHSFWLWFRAEYTEPAPARRTAACYDAPMHVAILGAGALGSILAAHLARAGEDVSVLARGERASLLTDRGLTLSGLASIALPVRILSDPSQLHEADLLIVTVKTYDTEAALAGAAQAKVSMALSVQNGLVKDEQLAAVFGRDAVLGAAADFSGELQPDGSVRFSRNEGFFIGERPSGASQRVRDVVAMLSRAGIKTTASEHIETIEWSKLVAWLGLAPPALFTRFTTQQMLMHPDLTRLQVSLLHEALRLTDALGIEIVDLGTLVAAKSLSSLSLDDAIARNRRDGEAMDPAHKISALQDLEHGRRLEVEATFGYVLRRASELGVAMPVSEACYRLLRALDTNVR
jgi:2-dehydropantoate 2-reductase